MIGTRIHITGIVQGVGFRPFVYNRAIQQGLTGWVCNTSAGVDIEVNGEPDGISRFINNLQNHAPPLSRIDSFHVQQVAYNPAQSFEIIHSKEVADAFQPISPDICICPDCLRELFTPRDRRYRYPFINCTNCGPRLTIIEDIPYDRPNTTMKDFRMCPDCEREYTDPTDRRFHAQPIACPECGPQVWLEGSPKKNDSSSWRIEEGNQAILAAQKMLRKGGIIAIKGLGGFHLACDATNPKAVRELRQRKLRVDKPFALMMADISAVNSHCMVTDADRELLESRQRPIVILPRRKISTISVDVSPGQDTLGVMLPYTPLHYLLFDPGEGSNGRIKTKKPEELPPLVMTSANLSEEPIAVQNAEARDRLRGLADAFLMHDRTIRTRCDDSVVRTFLGTTFPLRRSRGYSPFPVYLETNSPPILAVGAELKNTFCLTRDRYAFLSHHIGDMENIETYDSFVDCISHYEGLFRVKPAAIAYDIHPNYLATRYAMDRAKAELLPSFGIQHHHAHIAACMAENSLPSNGRVIGVAFDGTGYGEDGAIWGGEFLLADYQNFTRVGHLKYIPLPGGDTAIRKPARTALAYLWSAGVEWEANLHPVSAFCAEERSIIKSQLEHKINTPLTSSMGRFFDAVASLVGVRHKVNYEAQAAIEFEALADDSETGEYEMLVENLEYPDQRVYQINPSPIILSILDDLHHGVALPRISARFHNTIASLVRQTCSILREEYALNDVVLSGGVWQNMTLLQRTVEVLSAEMFNIHIHKQVPTNDGGLSLGQAVIAINKLQKVCD